MSKEQTAAISELTIPDGMPIPSHDEYQIGGLPVHVYGIKEALDYSSNSDELVILNLVHPRTRSYTYTERVSQFFLARYNAALAQSDTQKLPPCITVTFDLRNHGHRIVSKDNTDWKRGNSKHGQDMVTGILGSCQDVEFVMKFIPAYIPKDLTISTRTDKQKKLWNIVSGVSQGGHISWKVAAHSSPDWNLLAVIPIIGSPDLTTMLVHRLLVQIGGLGKEEARNLLEAKVMVKSSASKGAKSVANLSWSQLKETLETLDIFKKNSLSTEQVLQNYWPQALHDILIEEDLKTLSSVKEKVSNVFVVNSKLDPLVPSWGSYEFVNKFPTTGRPETESPAHKTLYEQDNVGHIFTDEMAEIISTYIVNVVSDRK